MLDQLLAVLDAYDFEEDGGLELVGFTLQDKQCTLSLKVWPGGGGDWQQWEMSCADVRRYQLLSERLVGFDLTNDHVLLWDYNQPKSQLHLHGKPVDAVLLAWQLQARHQQVTDDQMPFAKYLNPHMSKCDSLVGLLAGGYGLLARGPLPLLKEYEAVLSQHEVGTYYFSGSWEQRENEAAVSADNQNLSVLIVGTSYIIGSDFQAVRSPERKNTA